MCEFDRDKSSIDLIEEEEVPCWYGRLHCSMENLVPLFVKSQLVLSQLAFSCQLRPGNVRG